MMLKKFVIPFAQSPIISKRWLLFLLFAFKWILEKVFKSRQFSLIDKKIKRIFINLKRRKKIKEIPQNRKILLRFYIDIREWNCTFMLSHLMITLELRILWIKREMRRKNFLECEAVERRIVDRVQGRSFQFRSWGSSSNFVDTI